MNTAAQLIAIDWGSSKFRAYLLDRNYALLEKIETDDGLLHTGRAPSELLYKNCQPWLEQHPGIPVIMSGTVGGNIGWINTHYMKCPISIEDLINEPVAVENSFGTNIKIVPGVTGESLSGAADVMRGEEVQVFGALAAHNQASGLICLPGTHSKWVTAKANRIVDITSFMSGEFYHIARKKSSISSVVDKTAFDEDSFMQGLITAEKQGGILHHLFSARANFLVESDNYVSSSSYLSGVIIGSEIREALRIFEDISELILVANPELNRNYTCALEHRGIKISALSSQDAFIKGIAQIDPLLTINDFRVA